MGGSSTPGQDDVSDDADGDAHQGDDQPRVVVMNCSISAIKALTHMLVGDNVGKKKGWNELIPGPPTWWPAMLVVGYLRSLRMSALHFLVMHCLLSAIKITPTTLVCAT